jgi:hypothetical protein
MSRRFRLQSLRRSCAQYTAARPLGEYGVHTRRHVPREVAQPPSLLLAGRKPIGVFVVDELTLIVL